MAVSTDLGGGAVGAEAPLGVDEHEIYQRRHCGKYFAMDRHRLHLQNLARRKALEKEAAIARATSNPELERMEKNFRCCLNGANRSPARAGRPTDAWQRKQSPPVGQRPLRVPGAVPVEQPLDPQCPPRIIRHGRRAPPLNQQGPGDDTAATSEQTRRVRRQWAIGAPVHIKTAEGHILELHSNESSAPQQQPQQPPQPPPLQRPVGQPDFVDDAWDDGQGSHVE